MHPKTREALDDLASVTWFRRVGTPETEVDVEVLRSWSEAIAFCESEETQSLRLRTGDGYLNRVAKIYPDAFKVWDELSKTLAPTCIELVNEKCALVIVDNILPKMFFDAVLWDVGHLCMEAEFADFCPPGFYASQAFWYRDGRFPCGFRNPTSKSAKRVIY